MKYAHANKQAGKKEVEVDEMDRKKERIKIKEDNMK